MMEQRKRTGSSEDGTEECFSRIAGEGVRETSMGRNRSGDWLTGCASCHRGCSKGTGNARRLGSVAWAFVRGRGVGTRAGGDPRAERPG